MTGRLAARLAKEGIIVREATCLSDGPTSRVFRIDVARGESLKLRTCSSARQADRVWGILSVRNPVLSRPVARVGRSLVMEYVAGVPVSERLRGAGPLERLRMARRLGALLARLHLGPAPRLKAPAFISTRWVLTRVLRWLLRHRLLDAESAGVLGAIDLPPMSPAVVTIGDPSPDNVVWTPSRRLRIVDEDRLDLRPAAFDLARAVTRWPLDRPGEDAFVAAYRRAGGDADDYERHRAYWVANALATSGIFRLVYRPRDMAPIARQLRALARGVRRDGYLG